MKSALIVLSLVAVCRVSSAQDVEAPPPREPDSTQGAPTACANISCAGHGACVVVNGGPTCACDDGFQPDAVNGLNCLPTLSAEAGAGEVQAQEDSLGLSDIARVEASLGGVDLSADYDDFHIDPAGASTFADYMYAVYKTRKSIATAGIVVGAGLLVTGIVFYGLSYQHLFDDKGRVFLGTGIAFMATGGLTLGLSFVGMLRNRRRLAKLDKVLFEERHGATRPRFLGLAPRIGESSLGLVTGFAF